MLTQDIQETYVNKEEENTELKLVYLVYIGKKMRGIHAYMKYTRN